MSRHAHAAVRLHGGVCRAATRAGAAAAALAALLVVSAAGPVVHAGADRAVGERLDEGTWRGVLLRAADASQHRRYAGEALWITWSDGEPQVALSRVYRDRDAVTVSSADRFTVRLGHRGSDMVDHRQGWMAPLPAVDPGESVQAVDALARKYDVAVVGEERLLDRPCTRLEVHRREDGSLRERLWIDQDSGLVLRRETYEGSTRLRLMAYLSLDLRPGAAADEAGVGARATRSQAAVPLERRSRAVSAVDGGALAALRRAGWVVPARLPGRYEPVGVYAVDGADGQPLHVVYRDGLYTVSLFQQQGSPDWTSLPDGARRADHVDWPAYEWPGAVPRRLVWEASGSTFSLVGDAPPEEFAAIAAALPRPESRSLADRLRRGLGRIFSWVPQ